MAIPSLAKLMSRGKKGFPSVNTIIESQLLLQSKKTYSKKLVLLRLKYLQKLLEQDALKGEVVKAYNALCDTMDAREERDKEFLHPSELFSACPRAMFYRLNKNPETDKRIAIEATSQLTFDVGHFYHRYLQRLLIDAGYLVEAEVFFFNKDLNLIGHVDGLLLLMLADLVLEIKTANSRYFSDIKKAGKPLEQHVYQASIYVRELNAKYQKNIQHILFLYINKDTSERMEYVVEEKEFKELQEEAYLKLSDINESVARGVVPSRICDEPTDKRALSCVHCSLCFNLKK